MSSDEKTETPDLGHHLCKPDGLRVWRGFRSEAYLHKRVDFDEKIADTFVPHTAQQMMPLGLQAYFPALLPDSHPPGYMLKPDNDINLILPDEIALVVYPSDFHYKKATKESVAGRAYSLLHAPVFNFNNGNIPTSKSGPPINWPAKTEDFKFNQPYTLVNDAIDWQQGTTEVVVLASPKNSPSDAGKVFKSNYHETLIELVDHWIKLNRPEIDGSVLVASEHYLLYWEHQNGNCQNSLIPALIEIMDEQYMRSKPRVVLVPPAFASDDPGVNMEIGQLLDVRTTRKPVK